MTNPLSSADIRIFSPEISKFCYINKYKCRLGFQTYVLIFLTFLVSLLIVLKNMVTILMISAKMATQGYLKIRVFWKTGYDVIISAHDVTTKFLSHDSNYVIDAVMWVKFGNCSISMRKVIIISILQGFDHKNYFFWEVVLILLDSTKRKIVWTKITTFFKRCVSIILWSFSS